MGKNEDNFRLPCMMMSKNERRLVVKYISFCVNTPERQLLVLHDEKCVNARVLNCESG